MSDFTNELAALVKMVALAVVNAFVAGGLKQAILPSDIKDTIVSLLTQMMVNPDLAAAYCKALESEVHRSGSTVEAAWLHRVGLNMREEEIANHGFEGLTDDELADIALAPSAVMALADFIEDPETELGSWFVEALATKTQNGVE